MSGNPIDLASVLPPGATVSSATVSVVSEDPVALRARVQSDSRRRLIEDCKGVTIFAVIVLALVLLGTLATYEGFFNTAAASGVAHWGRTMLTTLFTGSVTFLLGRAVGRGGA